MATDGTAIDFAVVAYTEEGSWQVAALPSRSVRDLDLFIRTVRQLPAETWALGCVSVDDDFFVLLRVDGRDVRCLLSDVTAATDWPLAREVIDYLGLPVPDDEDPAQPGGDLGIVGDLGMGATEMGALCDDPERYPDEMLARIAERLGFGRAFQRVIDATYG